MSENTVNNWIRVNDNCSFIRLYRRNEIPGKSTKVDLSLIKRHIKRTLSGSPAFNQFEIFTIDSSINEQEITFDVPCVLFYPRKIRSILEVKNSSNKWDIVSKFSFNDKLIALSQDSTVKITPVGNNSISYFTNILIFKSEK